MNTDDLFASSSKASPAPTTATINDDEDVIADNTDQMEVCQLPEVPSNEEQSAISMISAAVPQEPNDKSITALKELAGLFNESSSVVQIPNESLPSYEKSRLRIIEMASFVKDGIFSDLLLVLLIAENGSLALDPLIDCILDVASACPEHSIDRADLVSKIQKLASWEYYGIAGASSQEEHLQLFRWDILVDSVECLNDHNDVKETLVNLRNVRESFKEKINTLYAVLQDEEKSKLKKRKLSLHDTPFKRQKTSTSTASTSVKPSSSKSASKLVKKKSQKLTAAEKAKREEERERKAREKEEERVRKEEEKAKKQEEKLRLQLEKGALKQQQSEEKARKLMEKEAAKEQKEAERAKKEAERIKKEAERERQAKSQKKLSGFFKVLEKKPVLEPVAETVSDFELYFRPFTPKATAIVAPINRFRHDINIASFDASVLQGDDHTVNEKFKDFCKAATIVKAKISVPRTIESVVPPRSWRYMKFAEDVRPPYYGTWTKTSEKVKGKTPFVKDTEIFDYDFDSEAEWEEDEPGEELVSEDEEVDPKEDAEEEPEDGWIVPHGYLSEDEGDVLEQDVDDPTQRGKARSLQPKVINVLVPILVSPSYTFDRIPAELTVEILHKVRNPFQIDHAAEAAASGKKKSAGLKKSSFPADLTDTLLKYILANDLMTLPKLVDGFVTNNSSRNLTKVAVEAEIKRIALKEKKQGDSKIKWHARNGSLVAPLGDRGNSIDAPVAKALDVVDVVDVVDAVIDQENINPVPATVQ